MALHHNDAALGDVVQTEDAFQIVADGSIGRDLDVLDENGAADAGAPSDVAIVEDDGILDVGVGVHSNTPADHGGSHQPAGENGSAGDNGVERLAAAAVGVEDEFGGRVEVAGGAKRPLAVVEIQLRGNRAQVHVGVEEGVDGSHIAPIHGGAGRIAGNPVGLKIVGVHIGAANQAGQNVAAEVMRAVGILAIHTQLIQQQFGGEQVVAHG